ncbi:MAG: type 1 glutamine amidotransferase domain-containing protein [Bacteroidota bacterium]
MNRLIVTLLSALFLLSCVSTTKENNASKQKSNPKQENENTMRILLVITSHEELGNTGKKTGVWLEEFAAPYYFFRDKEVKVTLTSPKGGRPPIDPKSELPDFQTDATRKFEKDVETQAIFSETIPLANVDHNDYDAIFYSGGYGPMWDLADNEISISLIESFYNSNKPVASVCHAPAIFKNTKDSEGNSLIQGKKVTAYSNSEEEAVQFTDIVPFLVEDMLKEKGGIYSKGPDWGAYALEDGLLITGQNPASAELVADLLLKQLN